MPEEFSTAVFDRLNSILPAKNVSERVAQYNGTGPEPGNVTYAIDYSPSGQGNNRILVVTLDIDVWEKGPDATLAETVADLIERSMVDWTITTDNQGVVRISNFARSLVGEETEAIAHVTLRMIGRCFRRL